MSIPSYAEAAWYARNHCDHAHCPDSCEHPQPFPAGDRLLCGRCWLKYGEAVDMTPCTPDACGGGER